MGPRGRVQTLELVGRLRRNALEQEATVLGRLWAQMSEIDAAEADLQAKLRDSATVHDLEAVPYMASFLRAIRAEQARLKQRRDALAEEVRAAEIVVRDRFRAVKANEQLLDGAIRERQGAQDRAEAAEHEEIALRGFVPGLADGPE